VINYIVSYRDFGIAGWVTSGGCFDAPDRGPTAPLRSAKARNFWIGAPYRIDGLDLIEVAQGVGPKIQPGRAAEEWWRSKPPAWGLNAVWDDRPGRTSDDGGAHPCLIYHQRSCPEIRCPGRADRKHEDEE
jgi:hypothetical protein